MRAKRPDFPISVYVVGSDVGLTKIGTAESTVRYLSMLQGASPVPLRLVYSLKLPRWLAKDAESRCHKELDKLRSHGSWFKVSPEAAWACVQKHLKIAAEATETDLAKQRQREELLITALS